MDNFKEKIETLMKGKDHFTIFLSKLNEGKFQGSAAQSGNNKNKFEIIPGVDMINFTEDKKGVNVKYTRIYSGFPPSVHNFPLSTIIGVEVTST